jgi:O-Antigen ligase
MKVSTLKYTVLSWISGLSMAIFLLLPFHAFLTVWLASNIGYYTEIRLWKELLLGLCVLGVLGLLIIDHKIRSHTLTRRLGWVILAYIALTTVWGLVGYAGNDISAKALGYGMIADLRFLIFFMVAWAVALRMSRLYGRWRWLVYGPAVIVIVVGLLQVFVLPPDVLRHFGYGPATIDAVETVNSNVNYQRIMATLRGANPLGAYLILPLTVLVVMLARRSGSWRFQAGLLASGLVVMLFSHSRSAWIGMALSVGVVLGVTYWQRAFRTYLLVGVAAACVMTAGAAALFWNNTHFQNFVFHTDDQSRIETSSNEGRLAALAAGARDVQNEPLGRGPGTAGPASVYNEGEPVRISENYYLQVGQETGWIGLILFTAITLGIGYLLWLRRADPLALSLFASLVGLTFVNMVSHAWTDDTIAYIWWGLAGIAIAQLPKITHEKADK